MGNHQSNNTRREYKNFTSKDLQTECRKNYISASGKKEDLKKKLNNEVIINKKSGYLSLISEDIVPNLEEREFIASFFTGIHSRKIQSGNIIEKVLNDILLSKGIQIINKYKLVNKEIDFMYFDTETNTRHIFELKLGNNFDTKKIKGEIETLTKSRKELLNKEKGIKIKLYFICYYSENREEIIRNMDRRTVTNSIIEFNTFEKMCEVLKISHPEMVKEIKEKLSKFRINCTEYMIKGLDKIKSY